MSEENVEALKAVYERWGAGDFWTPDVFDPDVEVVWAGEMPDLPKVGRGLSAVEATMRTFLAAWDDYRWEADRLIALQEDRVLVLLTARGRGKGSSLEVEAHWAQLWTFREAEASWRSADERSQLSRPAARVQGSPAFHGRPGGVRHLFATGAPINRP